MTAMNYCIFDDKILVAMDTLATEGVTKKPFIFTTKMFPIPHLRLIVCCTGYMELILDWFALIHSKVLAKDIIELNKFTPDALRSIQKKYSDISKGLTATVYHFGYSEFTDSYFGFAYRSNNDFISEPLPPDAVGSKPPVPCLEELVSNIKSFPEGFILIMKRQRELDNNLPLHERVGIGGEIQFTLLQKDQVTINTCYRFEDYRDLFNRMSSNIHSA